MGQRVISSLLLYIFVFSFKKVFFLKYIKSIKKKQKAFIFSLGEHVCTLHIFKTQLYDTTENLNAVFKLTGQAFPNVLQV